MNQQLRYFEQPPKPLDAESVYLLQLIDCNCNECVHMIRDLDKYKRSEAFHLTMQQDIFEREKIKAAESIEELKRKTVTKKQNKEYELAKEMEISLKDLERQYRKMKFMFVRPLINYGHCSKFDKSVSFTPGICQVETQHCFKHRRDENK